MLKRARIEKVIHNNEEARFMTVLLTWLDMEDGFYDEESNTGKIDLSYSYISRSFGIQYYPIPGDIVLCGFLDDEEPIIISFLSSKMFSKCINTNPYGYYFRNIVAGELTIKALQGNELYLDRKGSLRFIVRDQSQTADLLEDNINSTNYLPILNDNNDPGRIVNLTEQVLDIPKIEVTIGKVYNEDYTKEETLNDKSIDLQVKGYTTSNNNTTEIYSLKINNSGEIELKKSDESYSITISNNGEININSGNTIKMKAPIVEVDGVLQVKDDTGLNTGQFTTFSGTTVQVNGGIVTSILP